ncbi:MAG: ABC transporter permease [Gemmatimonadales bacterium]
MSGTLPGPALRHAARALWRRPALTLVALATLALGIGANSAIFSVINAVLLEPLPFRAPERLVTVWTTSPGQGLVEGFSSYPDFRDWREQTEGLDGLAAVWTFPNGDVNLTGGAEPQRVSVARITPGYFEVLGVRPLHGRTFQEDESIVGNHRRAILSYRLWHDTFEADTTLVGRSVMVNGFPYTVVGVMPAELSKRSVQVLGTDVQIWRPLVPEDNQTGGREARKLRVVGRLAEGVVLESAESALNIVASRLAAIHPGTNRDVGIRLVRLREHVVKDVRRGLLFLSAAVGVVLLGACANVANLLLIRAAAARKEFAVRRALGASRADLLTRVLSEALLLGAGGAVLGVLLAYWTVRAFVAIGPADIPLLADARIDGRVLGFTVLAALLTVGAAGLAPVWRLSRTRVTEMLGQSATRLRGREDHRLMRTLTVAQIALAMVLVTSGGLLVRSFGALIRTDPGIDPERILSFQLELPMGTTYTSQDGRDAFFGALLEQAGALPGVRAVTMASAPPLEEEPTLYSFRLPGSADARELRATVRLVGPDYFRLLGIPVLAGRVFDDTDRRGGPRVVVVSRALARAAWGDASPIGRRVALAFGGEAEVVGVAGDVLAGGLDTEASRTVYAPAAQLAYNFMTLLVKTAGEPDALLPSLRTLVRRLDPALPLYRIRTVDELVRGSVAQQRFQVLLIGSFSMLMLVLAAIGIYGVTAYGVGERTNELGLRAALGASRVALRWQILRESALMALTGSAVGGLASYALSGTLRRLLLEMTPLDLTTVLAAGGLLTLAALISAAVPANRAAAADPMQALRAD